MKRIVQPELLDSLPATDPRAIRSRRDLRRVNSWMRNDVIMADALQNALKDSALRQITELGAGDGNFLLSVAKKIAARRPGMAATLLDLQKNTSAETLAGFASLGWRPEVVVADVFDWSPAAGGSEIIIANLFLHHFADARLAELLEKISRHAKLFIAIEPHRFRHSFACAQLLRVIGCNALTLHDAAISIRAGFIKQEISTLWPHTQNWQLAEQRAGFFSHLFVARRTG
jgi:hypothetical protein